MRCGGRWRCSALLVAALLPAAAGAERPLPQRDLVIELREADEAQPSTGSGAAGWDVRSADAGAARERPPQQLRVVNGGSASMRLSVTRPLQVWQAVPGALLPVPMPVTQWIAAGQRMTLQPRWPGGREPVVVAVSVDSSRFDPPVVAGSAELPQRTQTRVTTTVSAPIGAWVTLAATGEPDGDLNVVSSGQAAAVARRMLQLKVSLAP